MRRVRDVLARVGAGGADQDALRVARAAAACVWSIIDVVAALDQRLFGRILDQVRVAVHDADHFDVVAQERSGGGRDHRVGRRGRAAGKQNRHACECGIPAWAGWIAIVDIVRSVTNCRDRLLLDSRQSRSTIGARWPSRILRQSPTARSTALAADAATSRQSTSVRRTWCRCGLRRTPSGRGFPGAAAPSS